MIIDYLLGALVIYGFAWFLNFKYFNQNPASKLKAWGLTFVIFIVMSAIMTIGRFYIYSDAGLSPNKALALDAGGLFAIIFYMRINRRKSTFEVQTDSGGMVASFDSQEKAEEYLKNNPDKNYVIK